MSWASISNATANAYPLWWDSEPPPTLGVREPRAPSPPTLTGGATAALTYTHEPDAEAIAESARVDGV